MYYTLQLSLIIALHWVPNGFITAMGSVMTFSLTLAGRNVYQCLYGCAWVLYSFSQVTALMALSLLWGPSWLYHCYGGPLGLYHCYENPLRLYHGERRVKSLGAILALSLLCMGLFMALSLAWEQFMYFSLLQGPTHSFSPGAQTFSERP